MISLSAFDYQLPANLIAQHPSEPRDHSRLLVLKRQSGLISDHHFFELPQLLRAGDVLVRNNTKVLPARIHGIKPTGGQVELLLSKRLELSADSERWECLSKPGLKLGQVLAFPGSTLTATCEAMTGLTREVRFNQAGENLLSTLYLLGETPLPPYIEWADDDQNIVRELYQTTYARHLGSAAAPTAGLHFTPALDQELNTKGIQIEDVTLHVGLGTFLPVKDQDISHHHMHSEWFELRPEVADRLNEAKAKGRRVIAVGTTSCRVLESCAQRNVSCGEPLHLVAQTGETEIFIYPPFQFNFVDALITNFHLPKSSLLMLLSAFVSVPNTYQVFESLASTVVGQAYLHAIAEKYRFYSFGDAMLIE